MTDWSSNSPFLDLFKQSRPWFTQTSTAWDSQQSSLVDLDADGWVRGFTKDGSAAPFDRVSTILNTGGDYTRDGLYVLDWKGSGTLQIGGDVKIVSVSDHRIVFDPNGGSIEVRLLSTDPAHNGDYIRDIRMYHNQDQALLDAGLTFNPDFVDRIDDFRVLRFMDWQQTNNSTVRTWDQAPSNDAAQYTDEGGVPLKAMVDLANETGADPWFNIPHGASAEYIRNFASYVKENLAPGLVARFEYSNEVWNWGFAQAGWARDQSLAVIGDKGDGWMQAYGIKAAEMARIVADVFGSETGTRALNVFSTQAYWNGLEQPALNAPDYVKLGYDAPKDAPFHVYAIAPYFGGSLGTTSMAAQVSQWISQGEAGIKAALNYLATGAGEDTLAGMASRVHYQSEVAKGLGWQLEGYEGGQHVVDLAGLFGGYQSPERTAFFTALNERPEMQALYKQYFDTWRENGGGMMAHFNDFGQPGPYGSWGIWSDVYGDDTPRSTAVTSYLNNVGAWWADDRPDSVFDGIHTLVDRSNTGSLTGGAGRDRLFGLDGHDSLSGAGGDDSLWGNQGNDSLSGGSGRDTLAGGDGNDALSGGSGQDFLMLDAGNDRMDGGGGSGSDWIRADVTGAVRIDLSITGPQATGYGLDTITGIANVRGGSGSDTLTGDANANRLLGEGGNDTLSGGAGSDNLFGSTGNDRLVGGDGGDSLYGQSGADRLLGGAGNDFLSGGTGNDVIRGGQGTDMLCGGTERDTFVFVVPGDTASGAPDTIGDFQRGFDRIDLRLIDADERTAADNDVFHWSGTTAGSHAVWYSATSGGVLLQGDVDGDGRADFAIFARGLTALAASDLLL